MTSGFEVTSMILTSCQTYQFNFNQYRMLC